MLNGLAGVNGIVGDLWFHAGFGLEIHRVRTFLGRGQFVIGCSVFGSRGQTQRLRFADNVLGGDGIGLGRCGRSDTEQLFVAGDKVSIFVEVADNQVRGFAHRGAQAQRAELPCQVIGEIRRLGEEVLNDGRSMSSISL